MLVPLQEALTQLLQELDSDASSLGSITAELIQALTDAAVFQVILQLFMQPLFLSPFG